MIQALEFLYNEIFQIWNYLINNIINSSSNNDFRFLNIINGTLINLNISWEVLASFLTGLSVFSLIYLFILFVIKLLGIFVWK